MQLSICMMVKNEAANLERCLNSLEHIRQSLDSELIIIDTGSTDNTIEIASRYTDNLYHHQWENNFSEMRNKSISYAKGKWIFIIDADEEMVEDKAIIDFVRNKESNKYAGAVVFLRNIKNVETKEFSTEMVTPRIFKNNTGFRYTGSVHNMPVVKGDLLSINSLMYHYGYLWSDKDLMERKYERTKTMLEKELEKDPNNIYYLYQLSTTYSMHQDETLAFYYIDKAYQLIKNDPQKLKDYLYVVGSYAKEAFNQKQTDFVIDAAQTGLAIEKDYVDLYYYYASSILRQGKLDEGIIRCNDYLKALDRFKNSPIRFNASLQHYTLNRLDEILCNLSTCYLSVGEFENAFKFSKLAMDCDNINVDYFNIAIQNNVVAGLETHKNIVELFDAYQEYHTIMIRAIEKFLTNKVDQKLYYNALKEINMDYGLINKLRFSPESFPFDDHINILVKYLRMNFSDLMYFILKYSQSNVKEILLNLGSELTNEILGSIYDKYNDINEVVENSLVVMDDSSFETQLVKSYLYRFLFLNNIDHLNGKKYFSSYMCSSIELMKMKYHPDFLNFERASYLNNGEEVLTFYLQLAIKNNDAVILEKALAIYPEWKGVILDWVDHQLTDSNNEIQELLKMLKINIRELSQQEKYNDALYLINEYLKYDSKDVEVIMLKADIMSKMM